MTRPAAPTPPSGPGRESDEPLDPKSPEGIAVAERLTRTLARIQVAIAERERAAAQAGRAA